MFELKLEDLKTMIVGLRESKIDNPNSMQRVLNIKIDSVLGELQDISSNADAITWFTGYDPKIYVTEYIATQLSQIKTLLERADD